MNLKRTRRRQFLKAAPGVAGAAAVAIQAAGSQALGADAGISVEQLHAHGERSHFVTSERVGSIGLWPTTLQPRDYGFRTPLQDSVGMVTPPSLHYILSHGFDPPDINPAQHRLLIHGMVDRPLIFSVEELRRLPSVSRFHFIECHGNSAVSGLTGPPKLPTQPCRKRTASPVAASGPECRSRCC
jgi:sulfane dehydrogenase subunit SoxC